MKRPPIVLVTVALFVIGVALMIPFEQTIPRILGVAALVAFIVCGVWAVANPEFLGGEDE